MKHSSIVLALALAACAAEAPTTTTIEQRADPCDEDKCPDDDPLPDCELCDETRTCNAECRDDRTGERTTCAEAGYCQSCDVCGPDVPCDEQCVDADGTVTTCETQKPLCQRLDVYCAFPVIAGATVNDIHESDAIAPAYMFFESYGGAKTGNIPQEIDGNFWDPQDAWASNFRGIKEVTGNARTQYEWPEPETIGTWYPYTNGRICQSVPAGSGRPILPVRFDRIFEHDEYTNPDDLVGSFNMARAFCETDVFGREEQTGWSEFYQAPGGGDVVSVMYRLWCYSCLDSPSATCSTGVVW